MNSVSRPIADDRAGLAGFFVRNPFPVFAIYLLLGALALIALSVQQSRDLQESTSEKAAEAYLQAVTTMRGYYSQHIVPRARAAGAGVSQDYRNTETSIPFPATFTIELAEELRRSQGALTFNFYSDDPFPSRRGRVIDGFERDALRAITSGGLKRYVRIETRDRKEYMRVAYPVAMGDTCVACHNAHPDSPRKDWKAGDIRGVQQVTLEIPQTHASLLLPDLKQSAPYVLTFALVGLGLMWLLLRELRRRIRQTEELAAATEQKNVELAAAKAALETSNRVQVELIANVGHELRTPLNAIIGFSEILKDQRLGPVGSPEYLEFSESIHDGGQRLLEIINMFLMLSSLEAGTYDMHPEPVALPDAVKGCAEARQTALLDGGIGFRSEFADDLPAVHFDRPSLSSALDCLLDNAIKFTPSGGTIVVAASVQDSGAIELSVADTGIGISPEMIDEICKPFRQADSGLNRRYEGVGLGLTTVCALARSHNTVLAIDSTVNAGTRVVLTIPAERVVSDPPATIAA